MNIRPLLYNLFGLPIYPGYWIVQFLLALAIIPWVGLVEMSRPRDRASLRVLRWLLFIYLYTRLQVDLIMWGPIIVALATAVTSMAALQQNKGAPHTILLLILVAGSGALLLTSLLHDSRLAGWLACSVLLVSTFVVGTSALTRRASLWRCAAMAAVSGVVLQWALVALSQRTFMPLVVGGIVGWIGLAFQMWRHRPPTDKPKIWYRLTTAIAWTATIVLMLLATNEVYFRYVYDASDANTELDTYELWRMRHVHYNSWGLRDREYEPLDQFRNDRRIVLLGDSFAFGQGIDHADQLLNRQLEVEINHRLGDQRRAVVFNLSRSGMTTAQELDLFNAKGRALAPQVVVLAYLLNDIADTAPFHPVRHPRLRPWRPLMKVSVGLEFVIWHAYLTWCMPFKATPAHDLLLYQDPAALEQHGQTIEHLLNAVHDAGAKLVVVILPSPGFTTDRGPQGKAIAAMMKLFAQRGVHPIDASQLVDAMDRSYMVNPYDPHPNSAYFAKIVPRVAERVIEALPDRPANE